MSVYDYSGRKPTADGYDYTVRIDALIDDLSTDMTLESNRSDAIEVKTAFITVTGTATFTGAVTGNADTASTLATIRYINGSPFDGSANIDINTYIGAVNPTDTAMYPVLVANNATGNQAANTDAGLSYNASTNVLTATVTFAQDADTVDGVQASDLARISTDNSYTGKQNFTDYSETAQVIGTTGSVTINTDNATYFYNASTAGSITFTFLTTAVAGRVVTFTLEAVGLGTNAPTFPASVDWSGGIEPSWSTGKDIVSFSTRDGGTTWHGYYAGGSFA